MYNFYSHFILHCVRYHHMVYAGISMTWKNTRTA